MRANEGGVNSNGARPFDGFSNGMESLRMGLAGEPNMKCKRLAVGWRNRRTSNSPTLRIQFDTSEPGGAFVGVVLGGKQFVDGFDHGWLPNQETLHVRATCENQA